MNSKSLRRLAADHGSLHTAGLPPNYLFPPSLAGELPSDLTSLDVLLAGPVGTPYSHGVWRLHLEIPPTYPAAPPTATFRTRLWHPNIDEATGAVCVETLKRDWSSTLKLRDVLVTISCLLIQPNPASALNEAAGKLASEDWDSFCRRAKLMTEIHAAIPGDIMDQVEEAQSRGDDKDVVGEAKAVESKLNGKGGAKAAPSVTKACPLKEDEENLRREDADVKTESDPEDDWIPGPANTRQTPRAGRSNIFGIQGLDNSMQLDSPEKFRVTRSFHQIDDSSLLEEKEMDDSDPFIQDPWKRIAQQSFSLRLPVEPRPAPNAADSPELCQPFHKNPFPVIDSNRRTYYPLEEFSWSWEEAEIMHETGTIKNGQSKAAVRKRLASDEFEKRRAWELKKFKKAGYDLKKYNRGEFGPRRGFRRL